MQEEGGPAIKVEGLTRDFGGKKAVDGVSFEVGKSEVFGFLGPNGAGKTTTIKMLTTLLPPTSGSARLLGLDLKTEGRKIRERIGVVQQQDSFDQGLSAETSMEIYGLIWNVPRTERRRRIDELMKQFSMEEFRKKPTIDLSAGQRRRLQVAREFIHDMDLLFLDEPTVGLDPIARRGVLDFLKQKVKGGLTIFFTTHLLDEAEYLCDRIAIINQGRILEVDTPANLKRRFGSAKAVEFRVDARKPLELLSRIEGLDGVTKAAFDDGTAIFRASTARPEKVIPEIYRLADSESLEVSSIYVAEATLEDAFISLVRDGAGGEEGRRDGS